MTLSYRKSRKYKKMLTVSASDRPALAAEALVGLADRLPSRAAPFALIAQVAQQQPQLGTAGLAQLAPVGSSKRRYQPASLNWPSAICSRVRPSTFSTMSCPGEVCASRRELGPAFNVSAAKAAVLARRAMRGHVASVGPGPQRGRMHAQDGGSVTQVKPIGLPVFAHGKFQKSTEDYSRCRFCQLKFTHVSVVLRRNS